MWFCKGKYEMQLVGQILWRYKLQSTWSMLIYNVQLIRTLRHDITLAQTKHALLFLQITCSHSPSPSMILTVVVVSRALVVTSSVLGEHPFSWRHFATFWRETMWPFFFLVFWKWKETPCTRWYWELSSFLWWKILLSLCFTHISWFVISENISLQLKSHHGSFQHVFMLIWGVFNVQIQRERGHKFI